MCIAYYILPLAKSVSTASVVCVLKNSQQLKTNSTQVSKTRHRWHEWGNHKGGKRQEASVAQNTRSRHFKIRQELNTKHVTEHLNKAGNMGRWKPDTKTQEADNKTGNNQTKKTNRDTQLPPPECSWLGYMFWRVFLQGILELSTHNAVCLCSQFHRFVLSF